MLEYIKMMIDNIIIKKPVIKVLLTFVLIAGTVFPWTGRGTAWASDPEDTMLMFVGEELDVLSIASRREESAQQAPAVAVVITKEVIEENGMFTLGQALSQVPGFYMAQKEWGTRPYLRGIPDSVLFLYDTVPMLSDMTKSVHPLDEELSLAPVKRIEIIRGPGSVLWGPDAFAGIVNVVPMTGKDLNGVETGIYYGSPGSFKGYYMNAGYDAGAWDGFISIIGREDEADDRTGSIVGFWGDNNGIPVSPDDRYGYERSNRPHFIEIVGNHNIGDSVTVSGRYSDYTRAYSMADQEKNLVWLESRSTPVNFIKLEAKKNVDPNSALRFTGYYSAINSNSKVIDLEFSPSENTVYSELIYDRDFLSGKGLLTTGAAYRKKQVDGAPIWDSYLPDYLGMDNETFLPNITEEDYKTELWSMFGQYSHKIGKTDISVGIRHDEHDSYNDSTSYNLGIVWSPFPEWMIKALYGTAYRTPFASQLIEEEKADLEKINTVNLKVAWQPVDRFNVSLSGFVNHISQHIKEDPYAGLSDPNHQKIYGIELEGRVVPVDGLELSANLTAMDNSGPDETYHYNDYTFMRPDGTLEKHFVDINYPFDTGPDTLVNLMVKWKPDDNITAFCKVRYFSSIDAICPRCETSESVPGAWLVDMAFTVTDIVTPGLDLNLYLRNITDKDYRVPGTYSTIDGEPFSVQILLKKSW